jgi:hypothetical protein
MVAIGRKVEIAVEARLFAEWDMQVDTGHA